MMSVDAFAMEDYYCDGYALMDVIFENGDDSEVTRSAVDGIYEIVGKDRGYFAGSAVSSKEREESITKEITMAIGMALIIIWVILTLTTTSWMEPFLFIFVMVIAIILNMGSNLMFGTISFFLRFPRQPFYSWQYPWIIPFSFYILLRQLKIPALSCARPWSWQ